MSEMQKLNSLSHVGIDLGLKTARHYCIPAEVQNFSVSLMYCVDLMQFLQCWLYLGIEGLKPAGIRVSATQ
jgi:hypothetical protein